MTGMHRLEVRDVYFRLLQSGSKTVEGRVAKAKYSAFEVGDTLIFTCNGDELYTRIIEVRGFKSFEGMLDYFGIQSCLPDVQSTGDAVEIYRGLPGYALQEQQLGVVGIRVELESIG